MYKPLALLVLLSACTQDVGSDLALLNNCGPEGQDAAALEARADSIAIDGGTRFLAGFFQTSADNQDPYVARVEDGAVSWCRIYSDAPPDERGDLVTLREGQLWANFITFGGDTDLRASADAFQTSFGQGGNKKVSFVARLDPSTGEILRATFLRATLSNGETNSLDVNEIEVLSDGSVRVTGDSAFTPPLEPPGTCPGGPFTGYEAVFDAELTTLLSGAVPGCL